MRILFYMRNETLLAELSRLGAELRFVLITSDAKVYCLPSNVIRGLRRLKFLVYGSKSLCLNIPNVRVAGSAEKMWASNPEHPQICGRCVENLSAPGETRHFA